MLKRRAVHKDMAEANVYAARRLKDMAQSLGGLAKTFGRCREEPGLSREDGIAALEAASAMVCGACESCGIQRECRRGGDDENYYLYYLLRTFEKKGCVEYEDMPRRFLEVCRRKSDYLGQLNRNLGRATMNLTWKNRFLESRAAVMTQFEELAGILEEFSGQMEQALDVTMTWEGELKTALRKRRIDVEGLLVLQYGQGRREVFMTARMTNGRCMTARDASEAIAKVMKGSFSAARDGKAIITRNPASFRFIEDGRYRILFGSSRVPRDGEEVSGDSYTFKSGLPGQAILSLSDGMGSGQAASEDSEKVIELTQRLLETGFSARSALKLVNTVLLLAGTEQNPATIDLCCIDLGTGVLEAMKLGAVPTFILGREGVEFLEAGGLPMGIVQNAEPVLMSRKMWDGEKIIMISDGILEAMPGEHKEETFMEFVSNLSGGNPQELAEQILAFASGLSDGGVVDDCTVLVGTVLERG